VLLCILSYPNKPQTKGQSKKVQKQKKETKRKMRITRKGLFPPFEIVRYSLRVVGAVVRLGIFQLLWGLWELSCDAGLNANLTEEDKRTK